MPELWRARNIWAEVDIIAARIRDVINNGADPNDFAVLCHSKRLAGRIAAQLQKRGLPVLLASEDQRRPMFNGPASVEVMAMHSSKGLEFDTVFIPGICELANLDEDADHKQQVRVLYVAMTRALRRLEMSQPAVVDREALAAQQVPGLQAVGADMLVHHHAVQGGARAVRAVWRVHDRLHRIPFSTDGHARGRPARAGQTGVQRDPTDAPGARPVPCGIPRASVAEVEADRDEFDRPAPFLAQRGGRMHGGEAHRLVVALRLDDEQAAHQFLLSISRSIQKAAQSPENMCPRLIVRITPGRSNPIPFCPTSRLARFGSQITNLFLDLVDQLKEFFKWDYNLFQRFTIVKEKLYLNQIIRPLTLQSANQLSIEGNLSC
ncbi:3'-5' exonuclease [Luteimonas kalidii]|uniref:DNA 3'-5' helicase II n=1 Tax=Luteimonas kalidii TaxID=3042025 RepID=A0ABT6JPH1_9GAMM|nr:3'-5' exonuclease [Luteimonas kalidii]MDH5832407.1 3'-5' exonuclease [Luteimonas kalidii]